MNFIKRWQLRHLKNQLNAIQSQIVDPFSDDMVEDKNVRIKRINSKIRQLEREG